LKPCWLPFQNLPSGNKTFSNELESKVKKLLKERDQILDISIPRFLWNSSNKNDGSFELHTFCDASIKAYGCAIYLVRKTKSNINQSTLIFAKSRIAPPKKGKGKGAKRSVPQVEDEEVNLQIEDESTIPRLELLATLIGTRATQFVLPHLPTHINQTNLWTDSTTVRQWLNSAKVQPPFIQNRLTEIQETPNIIVRNVPTKDNPADIVSRGQKAPILKHNELWWSGPQWLVHERMWPSDLPDAPAFSSNARSRVTFVNTHEHDNTYISDEFECKYSEWESYVKYTFHSLLWTIRRLPPSKWPFSLVQTTKMAEILLIQKIQKNISLKNSNNFRMVTTSTILSDYFCIRTA